MKYVFYTRSDYSDVWLLLKNQINKFLRDKKIVIFVNENLSETDAELLLSGTDECWTFLYYNDSQRYQDRILTCLNKLRKKDIILFHHEDMVLYGEPDFATIKKLSSLVKSGKVDLLKLCKASYHSSNINTTKIVDNVYLNDYTLSYAIQPTLMRVETLNSILEKTGGNSIWDFESNASDVVNWAGLTSAYYFSGLESKRGEFHWDSLIYPYFATAVVKGKWNLSEYRKELLPLLDDCGIDPNSRGVYV